MKLAARFSAANKGVSFLVMHRGKLTKTGSSATAYSWIVWQRGHVGPVEFDWIPPCRSLLERADDYPADPVVTGSLI